MGFVAVRGQDGPMLTVNGWTLSRREFLDQLDQIANDIVTSNSKIHISRRCCIAISVAIRCAKI